MSEAERNTLRLVASEAIVRLYEDGAIESLVLLQVQCEKAIELLGEQAKANA